MIEWKNFMNVPIEDIPKDEEYQHCNFSQKTCVHDGGTVKGHRLFPGDDTPRTFIRCNMCNCELPGGSTCVQCNGAIKDFAVLDSTEKIEIGGIEIEQNDYVDILYGRFRDGVYDYKSTPQKIPIKIKHSGEK
jgi:hypothetical protein